MQKELELQATKYRKKNQLRRIWRKLVRAMACVVVFCTTYALILPAITMEKDGCKLEEHVHSESCYEKVETQNESVLVCSYESLRVHTHIPECYDNDMNLVCGLADFLVHLHDDSCYNESGELVCQLPEREKHIHGESCYSLVEVETETAPVHGDSCYAPGELVCQLAEGEGHTHNADCYKNILACDLTVESHTHQVSCYKEFEYDFSEAEKHTHTEACTYVVLECALTEQPHIHADGCYVRQTVCQLPEDEEHTHDADCSENILACDLTSEPHIHQNTCYTEVKCDIPEAEKHTHAEGCMYVVLECDLTKQPHAHANGCYVRQIVCQLSEDEEHTHGADCCENILACDLTVEPHTHQISCYKEVDYDLPEDDNNKQYLHVILACDLTEQPHVHADSCYVCQIVCELPETEGHTHGASCYGVSDTLICAPEDHTEVPTEPILRTEWVLICKEPEAETHIHGEDCYLENDKTLTCSLAEDENHTHSAICYGTWTLICDKEEHTHNQYCMNDPEADVETAKDWENSVADVLMSGDWARDVVAIATSQLGYTESTRNYQVVGDGETVKGYTRYGAWYGIPYGDWCAMFASFCVRYAQVEDMPINANCPNWIEELTNRGLYHSAEDYVPQKGDLIFFDYNNDTISEHVGIVTELILATENEGAKIKTIEGNVDDRVARREYLLNDADILGYSSLPKQKDPAVEAVIEMINELPTFEELVETLAAYEEAGDMEAYEQYFIWVGQTGLRAYHAYEALTEEQKSQVTNIDRLMDLSSIWSVATLENPAGMITSVAGTVYARDTVRSTNSSGAARPIMVYGVPLSNFKETITDNTTLYVAIDVRETTATGRLYVSYISGQAYLSNFYGWEPQYEDKNGDGIKGGFILLVPVGYNGISSSVSVGDGVVITPTAANQATGDTNRIEYYHRSQVSDTAGLWSIYFGTTEKTTKNNSDLDLDLEVVPGADTSNLIQVNLFNYNSNINSKYNANPRYLGFQQDYGTTSIGNDFATSSFNFGNNITADMSAGRDDVTSTNAVGIANRITKASGTNYADVPISGAVDRLLSGGYPILLGFEAGGASTDIYFHQIGASSGTTKVNTGNINGLFQYNATTGAYSYDSRKNHAQFNASDNTFTLYNHKVTPNFMMYPFGNFMPFNDIKTEAVQSDKSDRAYLLETASSAEYKYRNGAGDAYQTLSNVLYKFVSMMDAKYNTRDWTSGNAVMEYFSRAFPNELDSATLNNLLPWLYTLDYDTPSDFYFGMNMRMDFIQPKGGMTGQDTNQDGKSDYPMTFDFVGDDDIWVFIDDVLFLDLGGIHRHVGGSIDFVNGKVYYYAFDSYVDGTVKSTPYKTETFAQILQAAGKSTDVLNEKGTFKDYSNHTFDFFYTERGSGSSVCSIKFNFPLLEQPQVTENTSISVIKELTHTGDVDMDTVGDPYFSFQIMKADANGTRTQTPFFGDGAAGAGKPYNVYDANTSKWLREGTTEAYGIFKIKSGERAEFTGISTTAGKYYVREILDDKFYDQYENIYVDGKVVTQTDNVWNLYKGPVSPVKDTSEGITVFAFNNRINHEKLSYLTITKMVEGVSSDVEKKLEFDMKVELGGTLNETEGWMPIPVGTPYTLYKTDAFTDKNNSRKVKIDDRPDRVVTTEGIVTVPGGATAEIDYMIPGTTYRVSETSESAEGYTVSYGEFWGGENWIKAYDDRVEGTIPVYNESNLNEAHVCMTVTNKVPSGAFVIPVSKRLYNGSADPNTEYTFGFKIELTHIGTTSASAIGKSYTEEKEIKVKGNTPTNFDFTLNYLATDFNSGDTYLTYKITEKPPDALKSTHDSTIYYATVKVTKSGNKLTTSWYALTKDEPTPGGTNVTEIAFTNTLLGEMSLTKVVNNSAGAQTDETFDFNVQFGKSETVPLAGRTIQIYVNGSPYATGTTDANGNLPLPGVKPGVKVTLYNIPLGTVWRMTEQNPGDYSVTWTANGQSGSGAVSQGNIPAGGMDIVYTNTYNYVYELPETGGAGTTTYTMAGLVLMLFSMVYLMYRSKARRREES